MRRDLRSVLRNLSSTIDLFGWRLRDSRSHSYVFSGTVSCPALFILGRRDVMTPLKSGLAFSETLLHAKNVVIDGSGHSLMAEAPDATLDALVEFFST